MTRRRALGEVLNLALALAWAALIGVELDNLPAVVVVWGAYLVTRDRLEVRAAARLDAHRARLEADEDDTARG